MKRKIAINKSLSLFIVLSVILAMILGFVLVNINNKTSDEVAKAQVGTYYGEEYKQSTGLFNDLIPGYVNSNFTKHEVANLTVNKYGNIITQWELNKNLDLNKFGSVSADKGIIIPSFTSNGIVYKAGNPYNPNKHLYWVDMFGFIKLPNELSTNGGTITISAALNTYVEKGSSQLFYTVATGNELKDDNNPDKVAYEFRDLYYNTSTVKTLQEWGNSNTSAFSDKDGWPKVRELKVNVRPGDKYARVSYVFMVSKSSTGWSDFGQKLSDVKVTNYTVNPTMNASQVLENPTQINATADTATSVFISGKGLNETPMTLVDGIYNYTVESEGEYVVRAIYANGDYNLRKVNVDLSAPAVTITGDNPAINNVDIVANIVDPNLEKVTLDDIDVTSQIKNGNLTISFNDYIAKKLVAIDKFGYQTSMDIAPTKLLIIGENVEVVDQSQIANNQISVVITAPLGSKVITPTWENLVIEEVYNYGAEAKYNITLDNSKAFSQVLNGSSKPIMINYTIKKDIDGVITENQFEGEFNSNANIVVGKEAGKEFIGIFNENNVLVASLEDLVQSNGNLGAYIYKLNAPITFTIKYATISSEKTLITYKNLAGYVIDKVVINGAFDENANAQLAPKIPYMTFNKWVLGKDNIATPSYRSDSTVNFNVTIDGVAVENAYFNKRIDLVGSEFGWAVNGNVITTKSDYTLFVTNDMTITKVQAPTDIAPVRSIVAQKDKEGNHVINGLLEDGANYKEVGFMLAGASIPDKFFTLENTAYVTKYPVYSITRTNQFILASNRVAFNGAKVKMYTIDNQGNIEYSDIITLA